MQELGRLEDLPQDYRDDLTKLNLVPLWPSLRAVLPPKVPTRKTQPTFWAYDTLRPLLMRAGDLLQSDAIASQNPDAVLAHFAAGIGNQLVTIFKRNPEACIGQNLVDSPLHFN